MPDHELSDKLAAIIDCYDKAVIKDATTIRDLLLQQYPGLEITGADIRSLHDLLDHRRLLRLLRDASTGLILQTIRVLLDRYGAEELEQMIRAMK